MVATAGGANDEEGEGVIDLEVEAIPRKKKVPAPVWDHGGEKTVDVDSTLASMIELSPVLHIQFLPHHS